jgi:hypothetical protein
VEPVGSSQTTGKLVLGVTGGAQNITDIDLPTGLVKPALTAFSTTATESVTDNLTFSSKTEVT